MTSHTEKIQEKKRQSVTCETSQKKSSDESSFQFIDNRSGFVSLRKLQEIATSNPQVKQAAQLQAIADSYSAKQNQSIQRKENKTGLPDNLKSGIENLSGYSMDDVNVHYNSEKTTQLHAHAYTQGTDIHLGPGQEKHLPHEAWHVVQQKQGRVRPTAQMNGNVKINDDDGLEKEADLMGTEALQMKSTEVSGSLLKSQSHLKSEMIQMVRQEVQFPAADGITLAILENAITYIDAEILALRSTDPEEVTLGWIDMEKIQRWRGQFDDRIQALRDMNPGDVSHTKQEIHEGGDGVVGKMRAVIVTLSNLRGALNESLRGYSSDRKLRQEADQAIADSQKASSIKEPRKKEKSPVPTPTKQGPIGLGSKWGKYNEALQKFSGKTKFIQYVPEGAPTIEKAIATQKITDAVFHTGKAFWLAVEGAYELASSAGKVKMIYTFSASGAKSLMEDYLICGSGDFDDDNEESWVGEAQHPNYTIWKTNEHRKRITMEKKHSQRFLG